MKTGIIYKAINLINSKVYIGKTTQSFYKRVYHHNISSKDDKYHMHNTKFSRSIRKYGFENFKWEILYENIPIEFLDQTEIFAIGLYDSYNNGYNSTLGGDGNVFPSEETRKKISLNHIDVNGKNNPFYGKKHTLESKQKMSLSRKGNTYSLGRKQKEQTKIKISNKLKEFYKNNENPNKGKKRGKMNRTVKMSQETKDKLKKSWSENYEKRCEINRISALKRKMNDIINKNENSPSN